MRRWLIISVFLVPIVLAGCAAPAMAPVPPEPSIIPPAPQMTVPQTSASVPRSPALIVSPSLKEGWLSVENPAEGFIVEIPEKWKTADLADVESTQLRQRGSLLFALDPETNPAATGPPGSLTITKVTLNKPITLDEIYDIEVESLERAPDTLKPVDCTIVQLRVGEAVCIRYRKNLTRTGGQIETIVFVQYEFLRGSDVYLLTFETIPILSHKYELVFEEIAQSFRFR